MPLQPHSFTLELTSDTSPAEAYTIGKAYLDSLGLQGYGDFMPLGSVAIPGRPGVSRFNYSYKA